MNYWLVDIAENGINGKALLVGSEQDLVRYIQRGGYFMPYEPISEQNAGLLSRFLPVINVPSV